MATTTHWLPNRRANRSMSPGSDTAEELIDTLSAPRASSASTSFSLEIPPPTVNGMSMARATLSTQRVIVPRRSALAVMSRNTSSSAPSVL